MAKKKSGPPRDSKGRFIKASKPKKAPLKTKKPRKTFEKAPRPRKEKRWGRPNVPRDGSPEGMRVQIRHTLDQVRADMAVQLGLDSRVYTHVNQDGSVDAELHVMSRRGMKPQTVYEHLNDALPATMKEVWISTGARFQPKPDDALSYYRYKGVSQVQTHYQDFTRSKSRLNILTGQKVAERVEKKQRHKIGSYFVRLFWSPQGDQPGRGDERQDRRKGRKRK